MATSPNSSSNLLAAVTVNDLDRLKKILQSGVAPNRNRGQRWSLIPLLLVARYGNVEMIKCLLQFKADVQIEDIHGWTALYCAASNGHADVVELLISHGADVNQQHNNNNKGGWTALHEACDRGYVACVRILLEHGADVALRDSDGQTARDWAVNNKKTDVVKLFDDFVCNEARAKGLPMAPLRSKCDRMVGELSDLKEKQSELDSVKAELESLKAEMKQLSAMNAKMAQLLASKAELDQLSTLKTEVAQLSTLKIEVAQLSASKADVCQLSTLKTEVAQLSTLKMEVAQLSASKADVGQLSTLKTEVTQLSTLKIEVAQLSSSKADVSQLSTLRAEVGQLLTLKTAVEQHARDLSSLVEELFPKEVQAQPNLSIDVQLRSISQRQDVEDNWWNIGKELGFSRREMRDFENKYDTNDGTMQPATYKMLRIWCENSNLNVDDEKMREIWRILGKFGVRDEE